MTAPAPNIAWICDYPLEWMENLPAPLVGAPRGEPSTWLPVLLRELEKIKRVRIHIIVLRKNVRRDISFARHGATFHVLKVPAHCRAASGFWVDTFLIDRALRRIKPDLVHAWGTERGEALIASRLSYPFVVTIQGLMAWYNQTTSLTWHQRLAAALEPFALRRARTITAESMFACDYLRQRYPNAVIHQIEHAANWIFHGVTRNAQLDPVRLLNVATMEKRKGTDLLLRALHELRSELAFEITMVGSLPSPLITKLRRELAPQFWDRVTFRSGLTPFEIAGELSQAALSILPTRADTSPNAVKEAVVAGVPVLATRIGGIPDYVSDDRNGLLFASDNLGELLAALRRAFRHPLFSRGHVDPSMLAETRRYLSPGTMVEKFLTMYELTLRNGGANIPAPKVTATTACDE